MTCLSVLCELLNLITGLSYSLPFLFLFVTYHCNTYTLQPSAADVQLTERLAAILNSIGITMVDHVIVAGDSYYSFAEHGLLRGDCLPPPQI